MKRRYFTYTSIATFLSYCFIDKVNSQQLGNDDVDDFVSKCLSTDSTIRKRYLNTLINDVTDIEFKNKVINRILLSLDVVYNFEYEIPENNKKTNDRKKLLRKVGEENAVYLDVIDAFCELDRDSTKYFVLSNISMNNIGAIIESPPILIDTFSVSEFPVVKKVIKTDSISVNDIITFITEKFHVFNFKESDAAAYLYVLLAKLESKTFSWEEGKGIIKGMIHARSDKKEYFNNTQKKLLDKILFLCDDEKVNKFNSIKPVFVNN